MDGMMDGLLRASGDQIGQYPEQFGIQYIDVSKLPSSPTHRDPRTRYVM